jgi:hypothetical protein
MPVDNRWTASVDNDRDRLFCLLEEIARETCRTHRESRHQTAELGAIRHALEDLRELARSADPRAALELDRLTALRDRIDACCPPPEAEDDDCDCGRCGDPRRQEDDDGRGHGWSVKARGHVDPRKVPERHKRWTVPDKARHAKDDQLPTLGRGPFVGRLEPAPQSPSPQRLMSGGTMPGGAQGPVTFRTFTGSERSGAWPPDCSGARGGDVVLMSGNLWLKLSTDGGRTFTDLDFTTLFAADTTYGGWAGDQVVIYVPSIDCFALYVQSYEGTGANANKNVVKIALASPADLVKHAGGKPAWWRQWDFTSDTFGLGSTWMDFPDLSYGANYLFVNTNLIDGGGGKLFFELPLADLAAGRGLSFYYARLTDGYVGSPAQNIAGDDSYFAGHVNNATMRIFHSRGGDPNFSWRDRRIANWPITTDNDIVSAAPDWNDWLSEDHRIIGATRRRNELWFAWTATTGDGGGGGFRFPHAHVQIAKFDIDDDFRLLEQTQVWNADHAYAYPSLTTNSDDEVGISLAWGGGTFFGSHAVGILGDFVVWYGEASDETSLRQQQDAAGNPLTNPDGSPVLYSRWGDYVHVRLAHPDTRFFSGFGYAVRDDPSKTPSERMDFLYVEFGRETLPTPGLR